MIEALFAFSCAVLAIVAAGLLVKRQDSIHASTEELKLENQNTIEGISGEVEVLTSEKPAECSLSYLEKRMETFDKTLDIVQNSTNNRREKPRVKRTKNSADD